MKIFSYHQMVFFTHFFEKASQSKRLRSRVILMMRILHSQTYGNIDSIAFGMGNLAQDLKNGQVINLAYVPEFNTYNGFENIQLKVKDIKVTS